MNCATGTCPVCRVSVGAIVVTGKLHHLFVLYEEGEKKIVYRGGPSINSAYAEATQADLAQEWAVDEGFWHTPIVFGFLATHRMEGEDRNYDLDNMVASRIIAVGPKYCGLDSAFTSWTARIGRAGKPYNLPNLLETNNSNAFVRTVLHGMNLPEEKPDVTAPGWGTIINLEEE